jgi:Derlin-2/3
MDGILQSYWELPPITRSYASLCFCTSLLCQLDILNPFILYLNWHKIWSGEVWRLLTNFFYYGQFGLEFFFHLFFLVRYTRMLEEGSFRGHPADFLFMLCFGAALLLIISTAVPVLFLGPSLTFMVVYLWGRRNRFIRLSLLGFTFTAPYLPWVLLGLSLLLGHSVLSDTLGICAGHLYYYLEDFYPSISGRRLLKTPILFKWLVEGTNAEPEFRGEGTGSRVEERPRPGGYDWGGSAKPGDGQSSLDSAGKLVGKKED